MEERGFLLLDKSSQLSNGLQHIGDGLGILIFLKGEEQVFFRVGSAVCSSPAQWHLPRSFGHLGTWVITTTLRPTRPVLLKTRSGPMMEPCGPEAARQMFDLLKHLG